MQTLMSVVRAFLTKNGHRPERGKQGLWATIKGDHGIWHLQVAINEDDRWLVCRSHLPFMVPERLRRKAAMLIVQLNDHLILGDFELDVNDGEVTFKTSARLTDDELTEAMTQDLLYCNFSVFDRCLPGFMALVYGRRSISYALKAAKETVEETEEALQQPQLPAAEHPEAEGS